MVPRADAELWLHVRRPVHSLWLSRNVHALDPQLPLARLGVPTGRVLEHRLWLGTGVHRLVTRVADLERDVVVTVAARVGRALRPPDRGLEPVAWDVLRLDRDLHRLPVVEAHLAPEYPAVGRGQHQLSRAIHGREGVPGLASQDERRVHLAGI